ncbi:MAG: hypothetical protein AB7E95_12955 [Kiritimatiellales bacterium]
MSLIQEALKRKSEEQAARPAGVPTVPEPATAPEASSGKHPAVFLILLIILLIAGLLAALTGLAFFLIKPADEPSVVVPALPTAEEPAAVPTEPVPLLMKTEPEPVQAVKEPPPEPVKKVKWPELHLSGIASGGSRHIAVINGKMLSAGRTVDGVRVIRVDDREVVVELGGEQRTLHVDE